MKAILRRTAALYLCCASTVTFAGKLPGGTGVSFLVGYNEAWFGPNYVTYLASNPSFGLPAPITIDPSDSSFVSTMFAGMANGGAKIVRIWVFTALQGIQLNPSKTHTQGLTGDLIGNLQTVFNAARKRGLKVYVTALNGGDMQVANTTGLRQYFQNLLTNTSERDAFKTKALLPLLNLLNLNSDVIYAFDLINEIEAPLNSGYFPPPSWIGARGWIQNMTAYVKSISPWLPVTSSGWGSAVQEITLGLFSGLGLDFYDIHVYADWGQYSGVTALCNRVSADRVPIILGEYAQNSHTFDDTLQYWTTYNFLTTAKTHCFSAALAWKYETNEAWWTYLNLKLNGSLQPDGSFRPAYGLIH
ncbi:MAG: hypothetical protein USCAAHI_00144 [Beijerinckiaceae bacterium]|jgi:hypothetical protein|nr:MAG: hypothetical protein USCAAHI_00144 [Beijerinckiaceae bacterium]